MANETPQQLLEKAQAAARLAKDAADAAQGYADQLAMGAGAAAHAVTGGAIDPFVFRLAIFVLAVFVGYYVVWSVTPALHTPLMSVTNAISSVIVVGALLSVGVDAGGIGNDGPLWATRARILRPDPRQREHLRRVPGHPAHAGNVQEEGLSTMSANIAALLYLVSGVLFVLALRGLSSPATSRQGNLYGMIGMGIAMLTTLMVSPPSGFMGWALVVVGLAIGGGGGAVVAKRIPMTAMPQLVAFFHSLVGMAAVLVAAGALYAPRAFGIGEPGLIHGASLVEMALGVAIGAITFTGSVIAFLKLDGRMSGKPIMLPQRHVINAALAAALVLLIVLFVNTESHALFWLIVLASFVLGVLIIVPIGGADMPVVVSMLNSYSGWAAVEPSLTTSNLSPIDSCAIVRDVPTEQRIAKAKNRFNFIEVLLLKVRQTARYGVGAFPL